MVYDGNLNRRHFDFLDGLRGFSILWLVGFHSIWFLGYFLSAEKYVSVLKSGLSTYLILNGHLGVDIFFVLSGFLITHVLFENERESRGLLDFYRRRAFRILPAYFLCLGLYALLKPIFPFPGALSNIWTNLLFINNYFPVETQNFGWSWSLAVEEHFYLLFPLLFLGISSKRTLLLMTLALIVTAFAVRGLIVFTTGPWNATPVHPELSGEAFYHYFNTIYGSTHMRFGGILWGVLARLAYESVSARKWLRRNAAVGRIIWYASFALIFWVVISSLAFQVLKISSPIAKMISLSFDRYIFAMAVAYISFYAVTASAQTRWTVKFFSSPKWKRCADLSYSAFLLNPVVICVLGYFFGEQLEQGRVGAFVGFSAATFAGTFTLSHIVFTWVETPFRNLGKSRLPFSTFLQSRTSRSQESAV